MQRRNKDDDPVLVAGELH
ncbi:hypothetical protein L195_g059498, partial [Trifolium pratense]